jgi:hypothetical protein
MEDSLQSLSEATGWLDNAMNMAKNPDRRGICTLYKIDTLYVSPGTFEEREAVGRKRVLPMLISQIVGGKAPAWVMPSTLTDDELRTIIQYYLKFSSEDEAAALQVIRTRLQPVEQALAAATTMAAVSAVIERTHQDAAMRALSLEAVQYMTEQGQSYPVEALTVTKRAVLAIVVIFAVRRVEVPS